MDALDLVVELSEQLSRDGIACRRAIEREDADATTVRCWDVGNVDCWCLRGCVGTLLAQPQEQTRAVSWNNHCTMQDGYYATREGLAL